MLELRSRDFYVQACADDLAVLVADADMLRIRGMAKYWASKQELQFSSKKTEIVLFTHQRNPALGSLSKNGLKLKLSQEARLLGGTLDSKLTLKPHITRITSKAITAIGLNATNIFMNLYIFCEKRVILSQLLTFCITISPGQPRTYIKQTIFLEVSKLV